MYIDKGLVVLVTLLILFFVTSVIGFVENNDKTSVDTNLSIAYFCALLPSLIVLFNLMYDYLLGRINVPTKDLNMARFRLGTFILIMTLSFSLYVYGVQNNDIEEEKKYVGASISIVVLPIILFFILYFIRYR